MYNNAHLKGPVAKTDISDFIYFTFIFHVFFPLFVSLVFVLFLFVILVQEYQLNICWDALIWCLSLSLFFINSFLNVSLGEYQSNWCLFINFKSGVYLNLQTNSFLLIFPIKHEWVCSESEWNSALAKLTLKKFI